MDIMTFKLTANSAPLLTTEILYALASARVKEAQLVALVPEDKAEEQKASIIRILRAQKKQGKIQLFASRDDFEIETTETRYLENKFPGIFAAAPDIFCYIVKL